MELLRSLVLGFVVVYPGLIWHFFGTLSHRSQPAPLVLKSATSAVVVVAIAAAIAHISALLIVWLLGCIGLPIPELNLKSLVEIVLGTDQFSRNVSLHVAPFIGFIAAYVVTLGVATATVAVVSRGAVRRFRWDRKFHFLRFPDKWHYLFSGEFVQFPEIDVSAKDVKGVFVVALVSTPSRDILYFGRLIDWMMNQSDPDVLVLDNAMRRNLDRDRAVESRDRAFSPDTGEGTQASDQSFPQDSKSLDLGASQVRWTPIPTDCVVLKWSEIRNLSLKFLSLVPAPSYP